MTTLRDTFGTAVQKRDLKNKQGQVVAKLDYIGWSQAADRLDDAEPVWSFEIVSLGPDWCHGRLSFKGRNFENVGYAENADADWKKEPLKDAVSDAFKRCAALAGVARYLYDAPDAPKPAQSAPRAPQTAATPRQAPEPSQRADEPPARLLDDEDAAFAALIKDVPVEVRADGCPIHHRPWRTVPAGVNKEGRAYGEFRACPERGCREKPR